MVLRKLAAELAQDGERQGAGGSLAQVTARPESPTSKKGSHQIN